MQMFVYYRYYFRNKIMYTVESIADNNTFKGQYLKINTYYVRKHALEILNKTEKLNKRYCFCIHCCWMEQYNEEFGNNEICKSTESVESGNIIVQLDLEKISRIITFYHSAREWQLLIFLFIVTLYGRVKCCVSNES